VLWMVENPEEKKTVKRNRTIEVLMSKTTPHL
jgi:hypothetical protein